MDSLCEHVRLQALMEIRANILANTKKSAGQDQIIAIIDALADLPEIEPTKREPTK